MKTIIKTAMWRILNLFYDNGNAPLHLREISRKAGRNESSISRHLNSLVRGGILLAESDGNMKKFKVSNRAIPKIFPFYDSEKLESLPLLRRNALQFYLSRLEKKPVIVIVFGSTAKGTYRKDSDMDVLEIVNSKQENDGAKKYAEAQTGIKIQIFQITLDKFTEELKMKKDRVVQSAIEAGFPVFNNKYFYEVIYNG